MKNENEYINIPVYEIILFIGIILTIIGILAPFQEIKILGTSLWFDPDLWILSILGMELVWGYITRRILNCQKNSFLIGLCLGLIGVIVAICIKPKNGILNNNINNKYDTLQKLAELKQNGTITEQEFEIQKQKILKGE